MPTLTIERFSAPSSAREARSLRSGMQRVLAALEERTVWCTAGCSRSLRPGPVPVRELDTGELSGLRSSDIVVIADPTGTGLAEPVRDRGAHALVEVHGPATHIRAVHAYLVAWGWGGAFGVAAGIPAAGAVTAKLARAHADRTLAWGALLADVLDAARSETVGGTFHPRPTVAAR